MTVQVTIDQELSGILSAFDRPVPDIVREMVVLELYRQARISSGKAARLLGMDRVAFIQYSSDLGIPFFDMTEAEWQAEALTARSFPIDRRFEH